MELTASKSGPIETDRLVLRPCSPRDAEALAALLTHPGITKTFMVPNFESPRQALDLARRLIAFSRPQDTRHLEYGIYLHGRLIGFINDCGMDGDGIELGWVIHPDVQGRGYATEAVRAMLRRLRSMGFARVTAGYFEENAASRRVMEKCGMTPCGSAREEEYRGTVHRCFYCEAWL